jgi:hypothetical protein
LVGLPALGVVACTARPPVYNPLPVTTEPGARDVVVHVRPVDTRLGAEDRRRYGVDIGAYFSAFVVTVENRTAHDLAVDLQPSMLGDPSGPTSPVLSDDELVRTYRRGGLDESAVELIAKAPTVVKRELEQIRAARMAPARLVPGGRAEGVLFFRPFSAEPEACHPAVLTIRGIEILEDSQPLEFAFPLDPCRDGAKKTAP